MKQLEELSSTVKDILNLEREPVGVKFVKENDLKTPRDTYDNETKTRYCQALMRASIGDKIMITAENISCPASAAAFGLKPLPEVLSTGKMLHNMGLFASMEAGAKAMAGMTRLDQGEYHALLLAPLDIIEVEPDVVVVESKPEHLMWLSLASIYETGERLFFDSAIFQATCVDSTVKPFVTGKINATLGCYGCRDATNIKDEENLIGIPYPMFAQIVTNLKHLAEKPMLKARAKGAYQAFK